MSLMKKEYDIFIQTKDVDTLDRIKPASILDFFQDIAGLHAAEIGVGFYELQKINCTWVVLYQTFEILKQPPYLDHAVLETWPKPQGRLEFEREFLMRTKDGEPLIKGISNWVVMDTNTRGIVKPDKIHFNGEYYTMTNYPEKIKRKIGLDASLIEEKVSHIVTYDDLDHNGHMNNAKYLVAIYNYCNEIKNKPEIKKVEISFSHEARIHDEINIGIYSLDAFNYAFIGKVQDRLCFECIVTMEETK